MIQIRFSFIIAALVMALTGYAPLLGILLFSVTLHELTHVFLAKKYGARVDGVNLTALGEIAVVRRMEYLSAWKRAAVLVSGPLANGALCAVLYAAYQLIVVMGHSGTAWAENIRIFSLANFILCVFNLLPAFPLDGGRLAQLVLGNAMGVPRANRIIIRLGRALGLLLLPLGLAQAVLYPYNLSLLCFGLYLWRRNRRMTLPMTFEFIQAMLSKASQLKTKGVLPVRLLRVDAAYPLRRVIERFSWDVETVVLLNEAEKCPPHYLPEADLIRHITQNGLSGTVGAVFNMSSTK